MKIAVSNSGVVIRHLAGADLVQRRKQFVLKGENLRLSLSFVWFNLSHLEADN